MPWRWSIATEVVRALRPAAWSDANRCTPPPGAARPRRPRRSARRVGMQRRRRHGDDRIVEHGHHDDVGPRARRDLRGACRAGGLRARAISRRVRRGVRSRRLRGADPVGPDPNRPVAASTAVIDRTFKHELLDRSGPEEVTRNVETVAGEVATRPSSSSGSHRPRPSTCSSHSSRILRTRSTAPASSLRSWASTPAR